MFTGGALLILTLTLSGVQCSCNQDTINTITQFWNGNPPTGITSKIKGFITVLTAPSFFANNSKDISCAQSIVGQDGSSIASYVKYVDGLVPYLGLSTIFEDPAGILKFKVNNEYLGKKVYAITLDSFVFTYYECNELDNSADFVGLATLNVNSFERENNENVQKQIEDGFNTINALNLETYDPIASNCDSCTTQLN